MKRKPILLAIALSLLTGAAIWGVNWRLDHPPLSRADKEFRVLVAGADGVRIYRALVDGVSRDGSAEKQTQLNAAQTRQFIEGLRFKRQTRFGMLHHGKSTDDFFGFIFLRPGKEIASCEWEPTAKENAFQCRALPAEKHPLESYELNLRFTKPLHRALDAYLPQRVRP